MLVRGVIFRSPATSESLFSGVADNYLFLESIAHLDGKLGWWKCDRKTKLAALGM